MSPGARQSIVLCLGGGPHQSDMKHGRAAGCQGTRQFQWAFFARDHLARFAVGGNLIDFECCFGVHPVAGRIQVEGEVDAFSASVDEEDAHFAGVTAKHAVEEQGKVPVGRHGHRRRLGKGHRAHQLPVGELRTGPVVAVVAHETIQEVEDFPVVRILERQGMLAGAQAQHPDLRPFGEQRCALQAERFGSCSAR